MDLTLHIDDHWDSPYAFSNFVALREKGLPFEIKEISLPKKEHHAADYRAHSLTGRIPLLRHGDFWLSESAAINEYIAETFPHPKFPRIYPEDLKERARARQLMDWVRSDLMPIRNERSTATLFHGQKFEPLSPAAQDAAAGLMRVAESVISDGRATLFANWCIADADFSLMLNRLLNAGYQAPAKIARYVEANWKRPSVREWVDHKRKEYVPY